MLKAQKKLSREKEKVNAFFSFSFFSCTPKATKTESNSQLPDFAVKKAREEKGRENWKIGVEVEFLHFPFSSLSPALSLPPTPALSLSLSLSLFLSLSLSNPIYITQQHPRHPAISATTPLSL